MGFWLAFSRAKRCVSPEEARRGHRHLGYSENISVVFHALDLQHFCCSWRLQIRQRLQHQEHEARAQRSRRRSNVQFAT